ncbi:hypothetical protein ACFLT1_01980 [Bacteroidota bacterium]
MKNQVMLQVISYYCLIIGAANLVMWIIIILTGQVTDFQEKPIEYIFHWASEFSTAIILIIAGIKVLRDKENLNFLFLALGFLIIAVGSAFIYYFINFDVPLFTITTLISGSTIVILILIYKNLDQLLFFTNGVALYGLMNILGYALQEMNISLISMSLPAFFFILIITINLVNKNVVFRYLHHSLHKTQGSSQEASNGTTKNSEAVT